LGVRRINAAVFGVILVIGLLRGAGILRLGDTVDVGDVVSDTVAGPPSACVRIGSEVVDACGGGMAAAAAAAPADWPMSRECECP
jgi:hypothetical protein